MKKFRSITVIVFSNKIDEHVNNKNYFLNYLKELDYKNALEVINCIAQKNKNIRNSKYYTKMY